MYNAYAKMNFRRAAIGFQTQVLENERRQWIARVATGAVFDDLSDDEFGHLLRLVRQFAVQVGPP